MDLDAIISGQGGEDAPLAELSMAGALIRPPGAALDGTPILANSMAAQPGLSPGFFGNLLGTLATGGTNPVLTSIRSAGRAVANDAGAEWSVPVLLLLALAGVGYWIWAATKGGVKKVISSTSGGSGRRASPSRSNGKRI